MKSRTLTVTEGLKVYEWVKGQMELGRLPIFDGLTGKQAWELACKKTNPALGRGTFDQIVAGLEATWDRPANAHTGTVKGMALQKTLEVYERRFAEMDRRLAELETRIRS